MSEEYKVTVGDFTADELDTVITMLVGVGEQEKVQLPEVPEKHKNKTEQGDTINALAAAVGMKPYRVTEGDVAALSTPDGAPEVDSVIIVAFDYQTPENTTNDESESEENDTDAAKEGGEGNEEDEAAEGDGAGDGDQEEEEEGDEAPSTDLQKRNPEPIKATGEQRYNGELVTEINNKIMNGRMYVEVFTIQASYVLTSDEAKAAGLKVVKK